MNRIKARLLAVVAGVLFVSLTSSAAVVAATAAPQSTDAASSWQKRHAAKLALVQAGGADVVFLGDDIVQAFEESYGAKDVWDRNWAAAPYGALNLGFAGDKTENVLWRITEGGELDGFTARVIVLAVGHTNIKVRGDSVENTVAGVAAILDAIRAKQPTAKIVLSAIVPQYATRDTAYLNKVALANPELEKLADGVTVRWCGYDKTFRRLPPGYIRWTGALMPAVNAALRNDVAPTKGATEPVAFTPPVADGAVNADVIVAAKRYVEENEGVRIVLRKTGIVAVDAELAKYSDGRHVIWCGVDGDAAAQALLDEAAAVDQLPVGPLYPADEGEPVVYDQVDAVTPVTRICESSWRGYDWWGDRLARNRDTIKASGGAIDFVFAGDSITHFWEDAGKNVYESLTAVYSILNCGYGGDQTQNVLWRFRNGELDGYTAKAVMLMIGTNNNGINGNNPTNTARGVEACIDEVKARQPAARIFLMAYLPRAVGTADGAVAGNAANDLNLETMKVLRADLADDAAVTIVDIYDLYLGADGKIPVSLMGDYIHPTEAGYGLWSSAVVPSFRELTGAAPARTHGDADWQAVGGDYNGRFDNPLHWNTGWVPDLGDRAFIGLNVYKDFTVGFPEGVFNSFARFYLTAMNGHSVTLDLSSTDFRHPENTQGTYNNYGQFSVFYKDASKDILNLNLANATPDVTTAPHLRLANTVVTAASSEVGRMGLDFNGGTINFDGVLGHEWTSAIYPRLYLFNFNNNGGSSGAPALDEAKISFRNGASLSARNLCVQGNAATNVLTFSGGTHAAGYAYVPARFDGQSMSEHRTVIDIRAEDGANVSVGNLRFGDAVQTTNRHERVIVGAGSRFTATTMTATYGTTDLIADGGTFEFGNGNQDFNPATPKYESINVRARNGGLLLVNQTSSGGLGTYLGSGGAEGKGVATLDVVDATLRITSPNGKLNFYNGRASFGSGSVVDNRSTLSFAGNTSRATAVEFDGATVTNMGRLAFGEKGTVNATIRNSSLYTTTSTSSGVQVEDATVDVYDSDLTFASGAKCYIGNNGGKVGTVNFHSGTIDNSGANTSIQFEIGWMGTGRLNVYGGTLALGRLRIGSSYTAGTDKTLENVLDIEDGLVDVRENGNGEGVCANYNVNRVSRIILNGGVLRCYRIYKDNGTAYLEANGGTVRFNNDSSNAIRGLDGITVGPKGLTIDNDGWTIDFAAAIADKADANGEGRLVLKGAGTTKFTGSLTDVSVIVADEGTVDLSELPAAGFGSLVATNTAVLKLDPAKTIALSDGLTLRNLKVAFATVTELGRSYDLFSYRTALTEADKDALFDALATAGLPTGGVADFAEVEKDGGYVLRATVRAVVNTTIVVPTSRRQTEEIRYKAADSVTADVARGAEFEIAGKVSKGLFVKDGEGSVTLTGTDNLFIGGFSLRNGRLTTSDPAQLGGGKEGNGKVALKNGVLRLAGEPDVDYGDIFAFAQEASTDHIIVEAETDATMDLPTSLHQTGGLTKRGAGRLTFEVEGQQTTIGGNGTHDVSKGFWSERRALVYPQIFDEVSGLMTNGTFGAYNVNEGELRFLGRGDDAKVTSAGPISLALPTTAAGTAMPGFSLDNVWYSAASHYFCIGSCLDYSTPVVDDFADEPYLSLTNHATLEVGYLYVNRLNDNAQQHTKVDVTDSKVLVTFYVAANRAQTSAAKATWNFRNSELYINRDYGAITLFRDFTMTFDHSVWARNDSLDPSSLRTESGVADISSGTCTMNVVNGSKFCCGTITPTSGATTWHPITLNFDDSEWIPAKDADYTFAWAEPEKILIVAWNAGLKLPVPAGRTWTMNQPVTGGGDLSNTGTGTLVLGANAAQHAGVTRCAAGGTVDLGGTAQPIVAAGAGTFRNGTVSNGGIAVELDDDYRVGDVPAFDGVVFAGRTVVKLGRTAERPIAEPFQPFVVGTYSGTAPNVSGWRLKGTGLRNVRGTFAAAGGVITCTPEHTGTLLLVR